MNTFLLTYDDLNLAAIESQLADENAGGHVLFVGTVRKNSRDKEVVRLEFESYEPMALHELEKIATEIHERWSVRNIILHHRLGIVEVGDIPVIAAVSAAHRLEAFQACEYLMNRLKQSVPVWKKEVYQDGEHWVSATP
jgi:molybdopterin synthase catalytic subunit